MYQLYVTFHSAPKTLGLDIVLIPLHSPLLGESLLVSFPSLNNMLKFSECSRLIWGQKWGTRKNTRLSNKIKCLNIMSTTNFNQNEWRTTHSIIPTQGWRDLSMTLRQALNEDKLRSAICVQNIDVQCVLQFTLTLAFCCVLHRHMSRVIHR